MSKKSLAVRLLEDKLQKEISTLQEKYWKLIGEQTRKDEAACKHEWHSYGWHHNDEYFKCSKCTATKFER